MQSRKAAFLIRPTAHGGGRLLPDIAITTSIICMSVGRVDRKGHRAGADGAAESLSYATDEEYTAMGVASIGGRFV